MRMPEPEAVDSLGPVSEHQREIRVGLLGCGNVGGALVPLVAERADEIARRTGVRLSITRVAVRNTARDRGIDFGDGVLTHDAMAVVTDPEIDVVIEVIGGIEPARELIATALRSGKPVITGNKELLANVGVELFGLADDNGVDLLFEAAVAGGIPLIRPLREAKAAIIATVAFGAKVVAGDVYHEGISGITASDIAIAARLGYAVKLLGIAEQDRSTGAIAVRVHPTMVPLDHPLASVRDSYNAVFVEGDAVGSLMFFGRGAGGAPTASAVLGDLVDAAVNLVNGTHGSLGPFERAKALPIDETSSEYLLALDVADRPGVLHQVTGVFARHGVSIRAAEQEGHGPEARLVFITHSAREADVQATVSELRDLDVVGRVGGLLRVIGE